MRKLSHIILSWRESNPDWVSGPMGCLGKATEELGEVARAVIGKMEGRAGRGDIIQEIAQTIIVLLSLAAVMCPDDDVAKAIETELARLGVGDWEIRATQKDATTY